MNSIKVGCKIAEVIVKKQTTLIITLLITLPVTFAALGLVRLLSHDKDLGGPFDDLWKVAVSSIFVLTVHELLHAFAFFYWGKAPLRSIKFGLDRKAQMPYCHCLIPVKMMTFRIVLLSSLIGTGLLTLLGLLIYPSGWMATVTAIAFGGCATDIYVFITTRRFNKDVIVTGHPEVRFGYQIFAPPMRGAVREDQKESSDPDRKDL